MFLIGNNGNNGLPEGLLKEIQDHQDILQSSREEEYHKTAYKILGAYIWVKWYQVLNYIPTHVMHRISKFFKPFQLLSGRQIHSQDRRQCCAQLQPARTLAAREVCLGVTVR